MGRPVSRVGRVLFALLAATSAARASADEGTVWFWFATCSGPEMRIAVSLDSVTLYKSSFPICQAMERSRSEIARGLVIETYPAEDGKPSPK